MKKFFKKFFASTLLAIFTMGVFVPVSHAQDTNTEPVWAKWYNSSLDKTFFEIPPDDRNLEDFIFTDQKIQYRNWSDNSDSWISENAKITSNLIWYKTYVDFKNYNWLSVITNRDITTFFTVVNNQYYSSSGKFEFDLSPQSDAYISLYWDQDENQNSCLHFDLKSYEHVKETHIIKNTCHMKFTDREPFLLFTQIERVWQERPRDPNRFTTWWQGNFENEPYYKLSFTLPYLATHEDKKYVTFYKVETFVLSSLYDKYKIYPWSPIQSYYNLPSEWSLFNSIAIKNFRRQWNQMAFRPYSFSFIEDYQNRYTQLKAINNNYCNQYTDCYITLPVEETSYFESFVLSVAAQYYNTPAVTNDKTYIEAPDPITWDGFEGCKNNIFCYIGQWFWLFKDTVWCGWFGIWCAAENWENGSQNNPYWYGSFRECWMTEIWCHIANVFTFLWNIFKFLVNGLIDGIKGIFVWAWEWIKWFFEPIIKPLWEEIQNAYKAIEDFFNKVFEIITNLFKLWNDPTIQAPSATQRLLCDTDAILQNKENIEQNEGIFWVVLNTLKAGFGIFGIIDPIAPIHGSQLCTYEGIKTLKLRENSFIDIILFLIFGSSLFLLFYRKS